MSLVVVERVAPVSRLFTVTVTPLTPEPLASSTRPEIAAETCPQLSDETARNSNAIDRHCNLGMFTLRLLKPLRGVTAEAAKAPRALHGPTPEKYASH